MKLYSKISSERASKGQGGNKFLEIDITGEDGEKILSFRLSPGEYGQRPTLIDNVEGGKDFLRYLKSKLSFRLDNS